jgi:hypothetical protein
MCYPHDRVKREKMLAQAVTEAGFKEARRRKAIPSDEFLAEVKVISPRAEVAGAILLTLLQLHADGYRGSLNNALPLVASLLPAWIQHTGPTWRAGFEHGRAPTSRRKLLAAWSDFRPVAHLWAAYVFGAQNERDDIGPASPHTLPAFLDYANAFLSMGRALPLRSQDSRFALTKAKAWTFAVPESLRETRWVEALPSPEEWIGLLDERKVT